MTQKEAPRERGTQNVGGGGRSYDNSLYPSAQAEPELGGQGNVESPFPQSEAVVATLEMTDITPIHELKLVPLAEPPKSEQPTVVTSMPTQQQQYYAGPGGGTLVVIPPTQQQQLYMMQQQEKLGAKCCGCFCDYRRAVIITSSFFMGFTIFSLLVQSAGPEVIEEAFVDDEFVNDVTVVLDDYFYTRIIFAGISIVTAIISLAGAVHFNIWMVGLHIIMLIVDYIAYIILALAMLKDLEPLYAEQNLEPASPLPNFVFIGMLCILFIYPQAGFISEVRSGILTKETYAREDYSCCCNPRRPTTASAMSTPTATATFQHTVPVSTIAPSAATLQTTATATTTNPTTTASTAAAATLPSSTS